MNPVSNTDYVTPRLRLCPTTQTTGWVELIYIPQDEPPASTDTTK